MLVSLLLLFSGLLANAGEPEHLQVGSAVFQAEPGSATPFSSALFRFRNQFGGLIWEAAVPGVRPSASCVAFVDGADGTRTGLALANSLDRRVEVTILLRTSNGESQGIQKVSIPPNGQISLFINELFPELLPDFLGSLWIETAGGQHAISAVALRETVNAYGEPIYSTLPVLFGDLSGGTESSVLPQLGAGSGISTQIFLVNPTMNPVVGKVSFFDDSGGPLVVQIDGREAASFEYDLNAYGCEKIRLGSFAGLRVGYGLLEPESGGVLPWSAALFRYGEGRDTISEAGVTAQVPGRELRAFVDLVDTQTGIALANPGGQESEVRISLIDRAGAKWAERVVLLDPHGHLSVFIHELFPQVAFGFEGSLHLVSSKDIAGVTLKLSLNRRGDPIIATLPSSKGVEPLVTGPRVFAQFGVGSGFSTRFMFLGGKSQGQSPGRILFYTPEGKALQVPFRGKHLSDLDLAVRTEGFLRLEPGVFSVLEGRITDEAVQPISGALILALEDTRTVSDSTGHYEISFRPDELPVNDLEVCAAGYERKAISSLPPDDGESVLDIRLSTSSLETCGQETMVSVPAISFEEERIELELLPVGSRGSLSLSLQGPASEHILISEMSKHSGERFATFRLEDLPSAEFSKVSARWAVGGIEVQSQKEYGFKVLGTYLHSRYNIPDEEGCAGSPIPYCYTSGDCLITDCDWGVDGLGREGWLEEVSENGSGYSLNRDFVSLEWFCSPPSSSGELCGYTLRNLGGVSGCPSCPGGYLSSGETVAVRADHPDLECGDLVFVEGEGYKIVTDTGNLPDLRQLDHFAGVSGCDVPVSIGSRQTIKILEPDRRQVVSTESR